MDGKQNYHGLERLRLTSSGTKIWNQFMMFVVVGLLPVLFPKWIYIENRTILFAIVATALVTSYAYEIWRLYWEKKHKDTALVINLQLITSVVLLTGFLHFFGRINGPFFILYLLTIMESFLNLNVWLSNTIVSIMIFATVSEFSYLVVLGEIPFKFTSIVELAVRVLSIIFIRSYGFVLAQKTLAEEQARSQSEGYAKKLERATRELQKANIRLRELSSLKDEFVSIASHELRTPMTTIKGYLWLVLNQNKKDLNEKAKRNLGRAYESTERMIRLVKDMLTVSRIEGRRLDLNLAKTDLYQLAHQVFEDSKIKAGEKKIRFVLEPPDQKLIVKADQDRIREVLENIAGNALKFTPPGGEVKISFKRSGGQIETNISDTGPGIPKESMSGLFQKFGRLEKSYAKLAETPGTGLGLYIAKQLVNLHKGKIWVKSKLGQGSTFTFSLPEYQENP